MKNVLIAIGVLASIAFLVLMLSPMMTGLQDFRTDPQSNAYSATTAVGVTNANVTLVKPLFQSDVQYVTAVTSNLSTDVPLATAYNSNTQALTVSGLSANTVRTLNVTYEIGTLNANIDAVANTGPTVWMFAIVILILLAIAGAVVAVIKNR